VQQTQKYSILFRGGLLVVLLFLLQPFNSFSEAIVIDSLKYRYILNDKIQILPDARGSFSIEDVASPQFKDQFINDNKLTDEANFHWIKVELTNGLTEFLNWHLQITPKQYNEVYKVTGSEITLIAKNGEYVRNSESCFSQNPKVIPINIPTGETLTLFIRINTEIKQEFKPLTHVEILLAEKEMKSYIRSWIVLASLVGILISLGFYILFQFFLFRDKSFLYFFLAFFSMALYFITFERVGYAITGSDYITRFTGNYLALFCTFFYIGFSRHFLDPEKKFIQWHRFLSRFQIVYIIPFVFIILINFRLFWNFTPYLHTIHIIAFVFLLIFAIKTYRKGHALAGYYLWANTLFFIFLCFFVYFVIAKPTSETVFNYFLASSLKIGSIGQVLLFTLALANRFGMLSRKVVEKQLENERLEKEQILSIQSIITNTNIELEKKVEERTSEIFQQKEELITQAENIEIAYQEITQQKNIIEKAHSQITDSLFYAAMIQEAVLPKSSLMSICFKDNFTLFWPRDIVSGDFYWVAKIEDVTLFAVADCTGHGVPGAFMSMLGISLLNEIVKREGITEPEIILNNLRINLINALQQESADNEVRDGMDIALCALYRTEDDIINNCQTLDFAGSHSPCYIVKQNNSNTIPIDSHTVFDTDENGTLLILKSDNIPLSKHFKIEPFTRKSIKVESGDVIYLSSDGIIDQLGGPDYKKFSTNRLLSLLLKFNQLDALLQKDRIEKEILEWMNYPDPISGSPSDQIDDFCIMGIRIR
jgi:serine phosphatase RsbU (regulator of sigma subunit)